MSQHHLPGLAFGCIIFQPCQGCRSEPPTHRWKNQLIISPETQGRSMWTTSAGLACSHLLPMGAPDFFSLSQNNNNNNHSGCGDVACCPSTRWIMAGGSRVQGYPPLHRKFETSLAYMRPHQKPSIQATLGSSLSTSQTSVVGNH